MTPYAGRHSELYDVFYADKPYPREAEFVHDCLRRYAPFPVRRILELACGTGRHAIEFARLGYAVTATDVSNDMLARARQSATVAGVAVRFENQDFRRLDLRDRPFDAVVCLFDSIGYAETNEGLLRVLQGVREHLRPEGLFVFEFWHAAAMLRGYEPVRVRRWSQEEGELLRISETELDCENQLARVTYSIYELRGDGTYAALRETLSNRYFSVREMEGWLTMSGLAPMGWFDSFTPKATIGPETWHVVGVARRV